MNKVILNEDTENQLQKYHGRLFKLTEQRYDKPDYVLGVKARLIYGVREHPILVREEVIGWEYINEGEEWELV